MDKILFGIVILHLVIGFGWLIYKLEFNKKQPKDKNEH